MKLPFLLLLLVLPLAAFEGPSAIGFYSNGSLENGAELPQEGTGYMRLYLEHDRGWGTDDLVQMITGAAQEMETLHPGLGRLQVEDLGQFGGGEIDGHASHQNGLDVDLTYYRRDGLEHDPVSSGQKYSPSMVIDGKISPNFDSKRNWQFMKSLHRHGRVQRIFVDPVIKRELCREASRQGEKASHARVLQSLRHLENHADHLHVRLRCPVKDKRCKAQAEVASGTGCP